MTTECRDVPIDLVVSWTRTRSKTTIAFGAVWTLAMWRGKGSECSRLRMPAGVPSGRVTSGRRVEGVCSTSLGKCGALWQTSRLTHRG